MKNILNESFLHVFVGVLLYPNNNTNLRMKIQYLEMPNKTKSKIDWQLSM